MVISVGFKTIGIFVKKIKMVIDNAIYLLNNFLKNDNFENVIFCWVRHQQEIIDGILQKLNSKYNFYNFSLVANEDVIRNRFDKDCNSEYLELKVKVSMEKIKFYNTVDSIKIDVSNMNSVDNIVKI